MNLEIQNLNKYACPYNKALRLINEEKDIRPDFFRDIDRIIHSQAFTRYIDKTQVFSYSHNDNVSKRIVHVQFVSKIARTIGRSLHLNEDLIEAASLGHDLGHTPFGHVGEKYLNELSLQYDNTYFSHNVQSVRTLMNLEDNGKGKNLTIQVLDAILCHNGELPCQKYEPKPKTKEEFLAEYEACYTDKETLTKLCPSTLEGCIVRISDIIAYLGRDIEDAILLGVITKEELPEEIVNVLGSTNKNIINTFILDIIKNSYDKPYILMSENIFKALLALKKFNYEHIYNKANSTARLKQIKIMFKTLFEQYLSDINNKNTDSAIFKYFLDHMTKDYLTKTSDTRIVIDFIAGMTDDFFLKEYNKIIDFS